MNPLAFQHRNSVSFKAVTACIVVATTLGPAAGSFAQADSAMHDAGFALHAIAGAAKLERAFWICDHASTRHGLDSGDAMACSAIAEDLRNSRFGGDLDALLAWWRDGRDAAYRTLDAAGSRTAAR